MRAFRIAAVGLGVMLILIGLMPAVWPLASIALAEGDESGTATAALQGVGFASPVTLVSFVIAGLAGLGLTWVGSFGLPRPLAASISGAFIAYQANRWREESPKPRPIETIDLPLHLPLTAFWSLARRAGWSAATPDRGLAEFLEAVRDACREEEVIAYGRRPDEGDPEPRRRAPLIAIPAEHWQAYEIDALAFANAIGNVETATCAPMILDRGAADRFVDLHVDRDTALRWLTRTLRWRRSGPAA